MLLLRILLRILLGILITLPRRILFSSKQLQSPFGVQGRSTHEARRAEFTDGWMDGWDRWMEWDGISKVSLFFGYIEPVFVYYIYTQKL